MQVVVLCTVGEFLDDVLLLTATQSIQVFLKHSQKRILMMLTVSMTDIETVSFIRIFLLGY